ncbi:MAG: YdcF family protein [Terriglobales bacterium]|jgi:vancomycin permeability regulator SanA
MRFSRLFTVLLLTGVVVGLASQAARFLVVDAPEKSDVIVVLAGETNVRPARALELLRQGESLAPRVLLDAETRSLIYDQRLTDIARGFASGLPEAGRVSVCPIAGFSTNAEAEDVSRCLQALGAHRVLIVTSDYHTRRALAIFRRRLPQYQFSVAAARNPAEFGEAWWTNREWAKTVFDEWAKTLWWQAVDRWR